MPSTQDRGFSAVVSHPHRLVRPVAARDLDLALQTLAPPSVVTGCRSIDSCDWATIHPIERELVARAVPKRRAEFASGRALLHELLDDRQPILAEANRMPRWPAGVRGSLAHDHRWAVAAVSRDADVDAVGIDIEPMTPLSADLAAAIRRPEERALDAHLAFVLKEATYKAWSALGGGLLDHQDVLVSVAGLTFQGCVLESRTAFDGRYCIVGDRAVALVVVPAGTGVRS
jgi:4'-phosphopantetheinyl transferase EntD